MTKLLSVLLVPALLFTAGCSASETVAGNPDGAKSHELTQINEILKKQSYDHDYNYPKVEKSNEEWRAELSKSQYYITREAGTERPFKNAFWENKEEGIYKSVCGGAPLFDSKDKYKSGTGWPSFTKPIHPDAVSYSVDYHIGYPRIEVLCASSGAHLGHVFFDGPDPTGLRYCINSDAMTFEKKVK